MGKQRLWPLNKTEKSLRAGDCCIHGDEPDHYVMSFLYAKSAEEAAIHHAKVAEQRRMLQEQMDAKAAAGGAATSSSDRTAGHGRRAQKLQDRQEEHPTGEIDMDHGFFAGFGAQQSATQQTGGRGRRAAFGRRAEAQQTPGREAPIQKAGIYAHLNVPNNVVCSSLWGLAMSHALLRGLCRVQQATFKTAVRCLEAQF